MKMRNVLASVAACAIAVSAMAIPAFAEKTITNANDDPNYAVDVQSLDMTKITGIKAEITAADGWNESGLGGCLAFNADNKKGSGWNQFEWGINGEGADAKNTAGVTIEGSDGKFTITYQGDQAYFAEGDDWDSIVVAAWWGSDFAVDSLVQLDKDGKVDGAAAADDKTEDSKADEKTDAPETDSKAEESKADEKQEDTKKDDTKTTGTQPSSKTGDAGVGAAVAGLALAGAAAVVARKRK